MVALAGNKVPRVDDVGHVVASALKSEFAEDKDFKEFISSASKGANFLRQSSVSFLMPPKLRTKGRFQGIYILAKWGKKLLKTVQVRGRAKKGSELEKVRKAFPGFVKLGPFIDRFLLVTEVAAQVMKVLKNEGLTEETYKQSCKLLEQLPADSKTKTYLVNWLEKHLKIHEKMKEAPLQISSDIIESYFGKWKAITERSPEGDVSSSILMMTLFCGKLDGKKIAQGLEEVSHRDLKDWIKENIPETQRQKRRKYLKQENPKAGGNLKSV